MHLHTISSHTVQGVWQLVLDGQALCISYSRRAPFTLWPMGMTPAELMQWVAYVAISSGPAKKA